MTLRISFSGTHNCGKTTLVYTVASHLKLNGVNSVAVLPELARFCPYSWGTYQASLWMITTQMQWEFQLSKHKILLMDRCVLDSVAYARADGHCDGLLTRLATLWLDYHPLDLLFYVAPKESMVDDGVRDTNVPRQSRVADEFSYVLKTYVRPSLRVKYVACVHLEDLGLILECVERVIQNASHS